MHMSEVCKEDGVMSEDFLVLACHPKYIVQCSTSIGWITVEEPEFRNGNSYRVISQEETK